MRTPPAEEIANPPPLAYGALNSNRQRLWHPWAGDLVLALVLALLPFLFFWRFITPHLSDRATFARGDFLGQYYPLRYFVAQQLSAGHLPLWNPYIYGGQPALADIQSATFYPLNLLMALILGSQHFSVTMLEVQVILHFSLAALFMYLLVHYLTHSRFAAVTASLVYTYSGYMTSFPVRQLTMLGVGVWLPLLLLFLDMAVHEVTAWANHTHQKSRPMWLVPMITAGLIFGISILGGHPQTSLYVTYFCLAYVSFKLLAVWPTGRWPQTLRQRARLVVPFLIVPVIGVGLAAVQLLPTLEFIKYSTRSELNYPAVSWGLPIHELVSLVYPGYSGNSPQYIGILPMILVILGLSLGTPFKDRPFWAIAAALSLVLSFGNNTSAFRFAYAFIPGFAAVRDQERVIFLFAFSAAVLSGYGAYTVSHLIRTGHTESLDHFRAKMLSFLVGFALLTALFWFGWTKAQQATTDNNVFEGTLRHHTFALLLLIGSLWWLSSRPRPQVSFTLWQIAALGLIGFNLFTVNWEFHIHDLPKSGYFPRTEVVEFLQEAQRKLPEPFRISSAGLLPGGSSAGAVYGLRDITGNSPLNLASFNEFMQRMGEWRMWQLLNVRYVLDKRDLDSAGLRRVLTDGEIKVYEMTDPFPPAWIVHDVRLVNDPEATYSLLNAEGFDARRSAVVDLPAPYEVQAANDSMAHIEEFSANRIVVRTNAAAPGLLVLGEVYYPGWQATVDGQSSPVLRADGILRAVPVPEGIHRVELRFAPWSLFWGTAWSAITLVVSAMLISLETVLSQRPGPSKGQKFGSAH